MIIDNHRIVVKPVTKRNWTDFEDLFESKGAPKYCWCMAWRARGKETTTGDHASRKKSIKKRIFADTPVGLLAYLNNEPIAWCSIAPRETHRPLGGDGDLQKVWSIVCFYVKRGYRKQGLTSYFIDEARKYAKKNGAKYLEAFPVEPDSPSYRFMGFKDTFEHKGFEFLFKAGQRRNVMIKKI